MVIVLRRIGGHVERWLKVDGDVRGFGRVKAQLAAPRSRQSAPGRPGVAPVLRSVALWFLCDHR